MQLLIEYSWPGNVRELENAVERAVVLASDEVVPVDVLPDHVLHAGGVKIRRDETGRLPADASFLKLWRISSGVKFWKPWTPAIKARQKRRKCSTSLCRP